MIAVIIVLLADFGEVIGTIIGLVLLVFWIIGQIAETKKKPPPVEQQRGPRPARPPADQADPLRREVDELLRRRQGERQQQRPRKAARLEPEIEVLIDEPAVAQQSAPSPPRTLVRKPLAPPPRKPASLVQRTQQRESVAQHTEATIRARSFGESTSHLGEEVALADDKLESRLHAKFDHNVGRLAGAHEENAYEKQAQTNEMAARVAELLATPQGVQQAVVLNEILQPPADRW